MFRGGDGQVPFCRPLIPFEQRFMVMRSDAFHDPVIKTFGPGIRGGCFFPQCGPKMMNDIAASQQENALLAQGGQEFAKFVVEAWRLAQIESHLNYGNICVRIQVQKKRPCPMIQSPFVICVDRLGRQKNADTVGQLWTAWTWVLNLIKGAWETAKVMNRTGPWHGCNGTMFEAPMGRKDHNPLWVG